MADFVTQDGQEINFDLSKMNYGQWLGIFDSKESDEKSDATIARVAGMTIKQLKALPFVEYRRLLQAFMKRTREPLSDPNV